MKITDMVRSHSDDHQTAFKTDPPITDELLSVAVTNFIGSGYADDYSVEGELIIFRRARVTAQDRQNMEDALTQAADMLNKQKNRVETARETDLQGRANLAGVPLVD